MPLLPRPGLLTVARAAYRLWRRLPPEQRAQIARGARQHGPRVAAQALKVARTVGQRAAKR